MHQIRKYFFLYLFIGFFSCIEPYEISIGENEVNKYIVSGLISDQEGYHYVYISLASQIDNPEYIPLDNCDVQILDDKGNIFELEESNYGEYRVWIAQQFLNPGTVYHLKITTPAGVEIISDNEKMPVCPEIDRVYYIQESRETFDPKFQLNGIQLYLDVDAKDTESSFFRWELEETWEYHASYPIELYYDGSFHRVSPPDNSKRICWIAKEIESIFTLSLNNIDQNIYKKFSLNFIDQSTSRLAYMYSLFIRQYSITKDAYRYWEQMKNNSSTEGGLYEKQPISVVGNLRNTSNSSNEVLGFFSVSSIKSKRIFINPVPNLELDYRTYCPPPTPLDRLGWTGYGKEDYPIYYYLEQQSPQILTHSCVDCTLQGGTNIKPNYWPN